MDAEMNLNELLGSTKQQLQQFCNKLAGNRKKMAYIELLKDLSKEIISNDLTKFQNIANLIEFFTESNNPNDLKSWFLNELNPFQSTNLLILCCKYNRSDFMEFIFCKNKCSLLTNLSIDVGKTFPLPLDLDDEQHTAFYYTIRNGNVKLLELIIKHWPNNYFHEETMNNFIELDRILGQPYGELLLKDVVLTDEMMMFVNKKLFDSSFIFDKLESRSQCKPKNSTEDAKFQLKLRIDLVLDIINKIVSGYSKEQPVDEKLLFYCRSLAKHIHILKKKLKYSYLFLPWEEIEFIIVAFVLSQTTYEEINLFFWSVLGKQKFYEHLEYFGEKLKAKRTDFINNSYKSSDLPHIHRHLLVEKLKENDERYEKLVNDFEIVKDAYTFKKILEAIDSILSVDPTDQNAPLVGIRVLQTIGEHLKNTLEDPNLSPKSNDLFLISMPKNLHKLLITLRNSFSHAEGLVKRMEITMDAREDEDGGFVKNLQNDFKDIKKIIKQIVQERDMIYLCDILYAVYQCKTVEQVKKIRAMFDFIHIDATEFSKSHAKLKIREIVKEFEELVLKRQEDYSELLKEINDLVDAAERDICLHENEYLHATMAVPYLAAVKSKFDESKMKTLKKEMSVSLTNVQSSNRNSNLKEIAELMKHILDEIGFVEDPLALSNEQYYSLIRQGNADRRKMEELFSKIMLFLGMKLSSFQSIEGLKYELCVDDSINVETKRQQTKTNCAKLLSDKFNELELILKSLNEFSNTKNSKSKSYKNREDHLMKALEITFLDIVSVMKWSNDKFHFIRDPNYLDSACPLLTTGDLRNYLAHKNPIFDVIPIKMVIATRCNAEKLLEEYKLGKFNVNQKIFVGKQIMLNETKVRTTYEHQENIIKFQQLLHNSFIIGTLDTIENCLKAGAEPKGNALKLRTLLHLAVISGSLEMVKRLVQNGLDPNSKDLNKYTPFHLSILYGYIDITDYFLKHCQINANAEAEGYNGPLHLAAENGSPDMIKLLLENGAVGRKTQRNELEALYHAIWCRNFEASRILFEHEKIDIHAAHYNGGTYLDLAAHMGLLELIKYLVERGASVDSVDEKGVSALHLAAHMRHYDVVEYLLKNGANPNIKCISRTTPLIYASEGGNEKIIEILLNHGADPTIVEKLYNRTPLHIVCISGHTNCVEILLNDPRVLLNVKDCDHYYPIHFAAQYGYTRIIELLIKHNASIDVYTKDKITPLHLAAFRGHLDIVKILVDNGAKVNSMSQISKFFKNLSLDPLRCAVVAGNLDIVKYLVANGATLNKQISTEALELSALKNHPKMVSYFLQKNVDLTTTFLRAAAKIDSIFKVLLEQKVNINMMDPYGYSLLHYAASEGKAKIVKRLIELGADMHMGPNTNIIKSPFVLAIVKQSAAVVKVFIENGALSQKTEHTIKLILLTIRQQNAAILQYLLNERIYTQKELQHCLQAAIEYGFIDMVQILLKHVNISEQNEFGRGILYHSVLHDNKIITQMILSKGVDVNRRLSSTSALHIVSSSGSYELAKCLIENGADVNAKYTDGSTPLHYAIAQGNADIAEILIKNGADVLAKGHMQRTPIELAVRSNNVKIATHLLKTEKITINQKYTDDKLTLLHLAAMDGCVEMTKLLYEYGADINARNVYGSKPIHLAARDGYIKIVEFYLNKGQDINEFANDKLTLIHNAALNNENKEMILYLLNKGANVNQRAEEEITPLDCAIQYGNQDIVELLLKLGATLTEENDIAFRAEPNYELAKQLMATHKLFKAVESNDFISIENLVVSVKAHVNAKNNQIMTILHIASSKGYLECMDVILKYGGNPNLLDGDKNTALHYAAKASNLDAVKKLLIHGAIYNGKNSNEKTPADLCRNKEIKNLFETIDKCFKLLKTKCTKKSKDAKSNVAYVVVELYKINDFETLKIVVRAKNDENETIVLAAMRNDVSCIDFIQQIRQEVDGVELIRTFENLIKSERCAEAIVFLTNVREKRSLLFGNDCPGNLSIDYRIAMAIYKQGNYFEALKMCDEIFKKQTELLGENASDTLESGSLKALILHRLGRNAEAMDIAKSVAYKREKWFGKNNKLYLQAMTNLAIIYCDMNRFEDALKIYTSCYEGLKKINGNKDDGALTARNNMGMMLHCLNRHDEALEIFQEVYEHRKVLLGPTHSDTMRTIRNIADTYLKQGKTDKALEMMEKCWDEQKRALGTDHFDTLRTQMKIAAILQSQSKNYQALKYLNEGLPKFSHLLGPNHSEVKDYQRLLDSVKITLKLTGHYDLNDYLQIINLELNKAIDAGNFNEVENLINSGADVNGKDSNGFTPLHFAARKNHKKIIEFLLKKAADPTQVSEKGNTPLHTAASVGNTEVAEILLKYVKDHSFAKFYSFINGQTKNGKLTALHVASKEGRLDFVKMLLKNGAIFDLCDGNGLNSEKLAKDKEIANLLKFCREIFLQAEQLGLGTLAILTAAKCKEVNNNLCVISSARNYQNKTLLEVALENSDDSQMEKKKFMRQFIEIVRNR